jgi:hypothetical protein
MTEEIEQAIKELKEAYGAQNVEVTPEANGGAFVIVNNISVDPGLSPSTIWCGFFLSFVYPSADVYPHYVNPDLKRADGLAFGQGFSVNVEWNKRNTIQLSRKSNRWNPARDTAVIKLTKIINWLNSL